MELIDYITDLLVEFDEMGFAPTTMCPNPEAYAIEWRNKITKAFEELTEENEMLRKENALMHANREEYFNRAQYNAILAMQERLQAEAYPFPCAIGVEYAVPYCKIDQIAKEMLEGNDDND